MAKLSLNDGNNPSPPKEPLPESPARYVIHRGRII
jgi:hypothetical protein